MKHYAKNLFLLLCVVALTYCALALLVVTPTVTGITDNQKKLETNYAKISDLENTQKELQRWSKNTSVLDVMVANVDHLWPMDSATDAFAVKVRKAAANEGVNITKFSFELPKNGTAIYTLEGNSSYSNIFTFIEALEGLDRFNTVPVLETSSTDGSLIDLKIRGQIYYGN